MDDCLIDSTLYSVKFKKVKFTECQRVSLIRKISLITKLINQYKDKHKYFYASNEYIINIFVLKSLYL